MLTLAMASLVKVFMWPTIAYLLLGIVVGMSFGIIPGLGGLQGLAILLPLAYSLDLNDAMAMMLGLLAVVNTTDTIPAVLMGVPGTSASAATIIDGYPMAKRGEAARALGAAYTSSMIGGVFGAIVLLVSIPIMRPLVMLFGLSETFMLAVLGLVFVSTLSGGAPLKGLAAAMLGLLLTAVGREPQSGVLRYDFGQIWLWDGLGTVPLVLGLFAMPELLALMISKGSVARAQQAEQRDIFRQQLQGIKDALKNLGLILRSSAIGVWIGFVPGVGSTTAEWVTYGWAKQSVPNNTIGQGDVRGVIAPECANNAVKGGDLIPTVAFGIPGSPAMALLLTAFINAGVTPGRTLLTERQDLLATMVVTLVVANIFAAGVCLLGTSQLVKIASIPYSYIVAIVVPVAAVAAYMDQSRLSDVVLMVVFGLLGFFMKQQGWPRPPLVVAFVLGSIMERNLVAAIIYYGADWLLRPTTAILGVVAIYVLVNSIVQEHRRARQKA